MAGLKSFKEKLLPRSLYARSLMIIVLPIVILQAIVAGIFIDRHWSTMSDKLVFAVSGEIRLIAAQLRQADTPEARAAIIREADEALDISVRVVGKKPAARRSRLTEGLSWYSIEGKLKRALEDQLDERFSIAAYPKDKMFEVRVPLDDKQDMLFRSYNRRLVSPATYVFILWLVGSSIILMTVSVAFMRNQIRPIHRLALAAEKLGKGQDVANFKVEGAREVRQAAQAFLDMQGRIRRQIDQRTTMLAGVSHDLRTPITRMKLQLALMKTSADTENLRQDVEEMERMLEGYLDFARGAGDEQTELADLKAMIERIVANAKRQGFAVEGTYTGDLALRVRSVAVERALVNIVSNACKYAKHAWVGARGDAQGVEVIIDDDGPGIPPAQREDVFKPFYRLEKSRNPKTGGVGLGLSIAQDIVTGHGGDIRLEKSPRGGLRAIIRLPA